jgi:phage host-nuclease inhibitor protein Gam
MSKNRIKTKAGSVAVSRHEVEALVGELALVKLNEIKITALMDGQIAAIRSRFESQLGETAKRAEEIALILQAWAEAHPEEFEKRKSIEFVGGKIGFRTGTPKLKTLKRWTWDLVLTALKNVNWGKNYIRTKEDVDKEAILRDYQGEENKALAAIGVQIVQDETFYCEPDLTHVETRETAAA